LSRPKKERGTRGKKAGKKGNADLANGAICKQGDDDLRKRGEAAGVPEENCTFKLSGGGGRNEKPQGSSRERAEKKTKLGMEKNFGVDNRCLGGPGKKRAKRSFAGSREYTQESKGGKKTVLGKEHAAWGSRADAARTTSGKKSGGGGPRKGGEQGN